jgi:hypothetical protein
MPLFLVNTHLGNVLGHAFVPVPGAVGQREFGADEAQFLGQIRTRRSRVDRQAVLGLAAQQHVDGFIAQLAQRIPDGQVDGTNRLHCERERVG